MVLNFAGNLPVSKDKGVYLYLSLLFSPHYPSPNPRSFAFTCSIIIAISSYLEVATEFTHIMFRFIALVCYFRKYPKVCSNKTKFS